MKFPKNFIWGSAVSSHQVEGNNSNDWTEWEDKNAESRAKKAKKKNWPNYILKNSPSPIEKGNYISGKACDHYNRFKEDIKIAKSLGQNAFRFSIEWSRIEPEKGKFNQIEIKHYQEVINECKKQGMEPFVTLWHFTQPKWISDEGGWQNKEVINYFSKYVRYTVSQLKGVKFWITLNEPDMYSQNSYLIEMWPPQRHSIRLFFKVMTIMAEAHKKAYKIIKEIIPNSQVGVAYAVAYFESSGLFSKQLKKFIDWAYAFRFLDKIQDYEDFIGINHYFHYKISSILVYQTEKNKTSDMNWGISPKAIYLSIKEVYQRYKKPIYITENGLADARDKYRGDYIKDYLSELSKTIQEDIDIRGYFHWSLLDNFEWAEGYWPRFGLVEVDHKTQKRKIKKSALIYKKIIQNNK